MAYQNKKKPQQGIYPGSGVSQGGNAARPIALRNGPPSSQSGGAAKAVVRKAAPKPTGSMKPVGSGGTVKAPVQRPGKAPVVKPVKPKPIPAARPAPKLTQIGIPKPPPRPVVDARDSKKRFAQQQAQQAWDKKYGKSSKPVAEWGGTPTTGSPTSVAPPVKKPVLGDLDTRDVIWQQDMNDAMLARDNASMDLTGIEQQLKDNPAVFAKMLEATRMASRQSTEASNANLAARGIFNSGEAVNEYARAKNDFYDRKSSLDSMYGEGAANALNLQKTQIIKARDDAYKNAEDRANLATLQRRLDETAANPPDSVVTPEPVKANTAVGSAVQTGIKGKAGAYRQGGAWFFRNNSGFATRVPNPTKEWLAKVGVVKAKY